MRLKSTSQILSEALQYAGVTPARVLGEDAVAELSEGSSGGVKRALLGIAKARQALVDAREAVNKAILADMKGMAKDITVQMYETGSRGVFQFVVSAGSDRGNEYGGMDEIHAAMKSYGMQSIRNETSGGGEFRVIGTMRLE